MQPAGNQWCPHWSLCEREARACGRQCGRPAARSAASLSREREREHASGTAKRCPSGADASKKKENPPHTWDGFS
ncbi:hypothetical protein GCM10027064_16310 [Microbacterium petrolearium]